MTPARNRKKNRPGVDALERLFGTLTPASSASSSTSRSTPGPRGLPTDARSWCVRFQSFTTPAAWLATTAAIYGLGLTGAERLSLPELCGFASPSPAGYSTSLILAGRRGGKGAHGACLALFECIVRGPQHMRFLAPGQRGHFLVLCRTVRQALECFRYARAIVEHNPELLAELADEPLESQSGGELRFRCGTVLSVIPASKSSIRGFTVLGAIVDEAAFLGGADEESERDIDEVLASLRFAMLAPVNAPMRRMMVLTTPGVRAGWVYETVQRHHGKSGAPVLVARGASYTWNPSLDRAKLEAERELDPRRYEREVEAQFVDAINPWCPGDLIDACAVGRNAQPLRFREHVHYTLTIDFATKRDATGATVAHAEPDGTIIVDGAWRWAPRPGMPLQVSVIAGFVAEIAHAYRVRRIAADQFSFAALREVFRGHGLELVERVATEASKLQKFGALRELILGGKISLPDNPDLLVELRGLEEKSTMSGHVKISGRRDDVAHACAWAVGELVRKADAPKFESVPTALFRRDAHANALDGSRVTDREHKPNVGGYRR